MISKSRMTKLVKTGFRASIFTALIGATTTLVFSHLTFARAASNSVKISVSGDQRCMESNGIADHSTGTFPTKGNPNTISEQNIRLCVPLNPVKGATAKTLRGTVGFALNGIIMRPGTADWYDASSSRGHSRNRSSGWNLEGLGAAEMLGMDQNNAHVDNQGIYHYHGPSPAIMNAAEGTLIGYAADGHEIHYIGSSAKSSWQLKPGTRPTEPFGKYDGLFEQDWEYSAGSGNLDQCNGGTMNGTYVYFATDTFPFFPRCAYGNISSDFGRPGGGPGTQNQGNNDQAQGSQRRPSDNQRQNRRGPPQVALAACSTKSVGSRCSFNGRRGQVRGTCAMTPNQQKTCRPRR